MDTPVRQIPIRQLISNMQGQNDWFNGCMAYLMERLGEDAVYDYGFFSGVTGDSFTQVFSKDPGRMALCYSDSRPADAIQRAFEACGYGYDAFLAPPEGGWSALGERIRAYIDGNVPVIARVKDRYHAFAILCGYDGGGFYFVMGEDTVPKRCSYDALVFVTEKKGAPALADVYRSAVMDIPHWLTLEGTAEYAFGKQAFSEWARSLEDGRYEGIADDDPRWHTHEDPDFTCWNMHGSYLCMLGTNACAIGFLEEALRLNPDMAFIQRLATLYARQNLDGFASLVQMEGGFRLPPKRIKNRSRMGPVSAKIRELAALCDDMMAVFAPVKEDAGRS